MASENGAGHLRWLIENRKRQNRDYEISFKKAEKERNVRLREAGFPERATGSSSGEAWHQPGGKWRRAGGAGHQPDDKWHTPGGAWHQPDDRWSTPGETWWRRR